MPGKFHGHRSLAGYSPWGCKESCVTEHTHIQYLSFTDLFHLAWCPQGPSMLSQMVRCSSFLMDELYSIVCACVCVCVCVCVHHFLFIYSSVDRHLCCFHILAIDIVLQSTLGCIYVFNFLSQFLLGKCPRVLLLDHMVVPFLIF